MAPLIADPRLRKLSFTGSTEIGRPLLAQAAHGVLRVSMELGGNAPFLIFEDADVDAAVEGAMIAKMRNMRRSLHRRESVPRRPQSSWRVHRQARRPDGRDEGRPWRRRWRPGRPADRRAPARQSCRAGRRRGWEGRQHCPRRPAPRWPRLLLPADGARRRPADAELLREEIFGPVAPVTTFEDEEDAIAAANKTEYGLVAYVYTRDIKRALRVTEALETGMVGLNQGLVSKPALLRRRQSLRLRSRRRRRGPARVPSDGITSR